MEDRSTPFTPTTPHADHGERPSIGRGSHITTESAGVRIAIAVRPAYLPGESAPDPADGRPPLYLFMYEVTITNDPASTAAARLTHRHWVIVDADGDRREVRGEGVVGNQPRLAPGESYSYASSCPLPTPWGTMEGSYRFERDDGSCFNAAVARFYLVSSPASTAVGDGL